HFIFINLFSNIIIIQVYLNVCIYPNTININ
ncbi:unnamed protein product, partial [marine sediment metagenome]